MIERENLPSESQPHKTIYGKLSNWMNGINPYPPKPVSDNNIYIYIYIQGANRRPTRPLTPPHEFPRTAARKPKREEITSNIPSSQLIHANTAEPIRIRSPIEIEEEIEVITVVENKADIQYSAHAEYDPHPVDMSPPQMKGMIQMGKIKEVSPENIEVLDIGERDEISDIKESHPESAEEYGVIPITHFGVIGEEEKERNPMANEEDVHVDIQDISNQYIE